MEHGQYLECDCILFLIEVESSNDVKIHDDP